MAKRKHHSRRHTTGPQAEAAPLADSALISGYDGANTSIRRGQIFWPTLDTRLELDAFSRAELLRRIRWLRANVGFVKGLINNAADLIGWLTPTAITADEEWNALADENFKYRAGSKSSFDRAGKFDFAGAQGMLLRCALRDGDALAVLTESQTGGAMCAFFESPQIVNPKDADKTVWKDGVMESPGGYHMKYGLATRDRKTVVPVSSRDAIYFGAFESGGHTRAVPPLAHAINHAVDITEVWADVKHAIKNAALYGVVRERDQGSTQKTRAGLGAALGTLGTGDGTGSVFETSTVYAGGLIPQGGPGEKFKVLHDERPGPNQQAFIEELKRDCCIGYGLPYEVVVRMEKLTGPGVRFIMEFAGQWIRKWQRRLRNDFCHRYWVYHMSKEIKAGRLPEPKDPFWALKCSWTPQRSLTIDRGRDGKQKLDEIKNGLGTWDDFWTEWYGAQWRDKTRQRIREVAFAESECAAAGVSYERVFGESSSSAADAAEDADNGDGNPRQTAETDYDNNE